MSASNRDFMLDYLGNIMEDASDFSWDSAKTVHEYFTHKN